MCQLHIKKSIVDTNSDSMHVPCQRISLFQTIILEITLFENVKINRLGKLEKLLSSKWFLPVFNFAAVKKVVKSFSLITSFSLFIFLSVFLQLFVFLVTIHLLVTGYNEIWKTTIKISKQKKWNKIKTVVDNDGRAASKLKLLTFRFFVKSRK